MQQILNLSNEFCSKLASDPTSLSDFVRQSVKELTSLSKLIKPLNDYGSLLTSKKLLEAASSGESSPCYSDNDEEDLSKKTRNKSISLHEIAQMFLDTSSTIEITQVTQDGSWYSWLMLHGLHEERDINGLQKLLDKHLKLKYESMKLQIYKGKKSLVIQCKDYFSAQKTFHFLDEDFYAKAYIKKRWPVIRFYNRMAEPKYMAQFYGIILKNLPSDCTVETIANLIKMNCPSVSCLSVEIPTQIEDTIATVIRTKNLEDAEMMALTLNDLASENTTIQAGLHPSCSLKQENSAKGPFKEIKGTGQNTSTGSEAKNNVKDLLSMFKDGQQKPLASNKKENKDLQNEGIKEGQRSVSLDPRERANGKSLKNLQKMETEEVRMNLEKEKIQQEDSSQLLYSPTQRSPRGQNEASPARKILYDDEMEGNKKAELPINPPYVNNQQFQGPPMHQHGLNKPNFPMSPRSMAGPGMPFQRPPMEDFHRQGNHMPEMYRRENNFPNSPHFNDRRPFPPQDSFSHQNPYIGHNMPHMEHQRGPPHPHMDMRNPNINPYPQPPHREMNNPEPYIEQFTPEDTKMRPKYKRMIMKGPLYPTMAFKKKMMVENHALQMSDIPKYYIPEDRKNNVSKISLKKLWQPEYREKRNMSSRYLMHRLQRMAMREPPLANRLNTITGFEGPLISRKPIEQEKRPEQKVISTQINDWKLDINTAARPLPMSQNISIADMYSPKNLVKPNINAVESVNGRPGFNNEMYKKNNEPVPEQVIPKTIKNFSKLPYWATRPLDNRQMDQNEFLQRRLIERSWQEQEKPVVNNPPVPKSEPIQVPKAQIEVKVEAKSAEQASQENAKYIQQQLRSASDKDLSSDWKIVFNVEPPKPKPPSGLPPNKINEKIPVVASNIDNNISPNKPLLISQSMMKKSEKIEEVEVKKSNTQPKKTDPVEKTPTQENDVIVSPVTKKPIIQEKDNLNKSNFQKLKQNLLDFQKKSNDSLSYRSSQRYLDEEESETSSSDGDDTIIATLIKKRAEAKLKAQNAANQNVDKREIAEDKAQESNKEKMIEEKSKEEIAEENKWFVNHVKTQKDFNLNNDPYLAVSNKVVKGKSKEDEALSLDKKGEKAKNSDSSRRGHEIKKINTDQAGLQVAASPQNYSPQILLNQTFSSFSSYQMPQNLVRNQADSNSTVEPKEVKEDQTKATNPSNPQNHPNAPVVNPPNHMTFTSHISHVPTMGYMYLPNISSTITYSSLLMNMMAPNYPQTYPQVPQNSDPMSFNPQMMVYHNNMIVNPYAQSAPYYVHQNTMPENTSKRARKAEKGKFYNQKNFKNSMDRKPYDDMQALSGQKRTHQSFISLADEAAKDKEGRTPEICPEPEETPPTMPVEQPNGNELADFASSKRVIRDGVDCDAKNIHKSL